LRDKLIERSFLPNVGANDDDDAGDDDLED
jgi:hypothetical protein